MHIWWKTSSFQSHPHLSVYSENVCYSYSVLFLFLFPAFRFSNLSFVLQINCIIFSHWLHCIGEKAINFRLCCRQLSACHAAVYLPLYTKQLILIFSHVISGWLLSLIFAIIYKYDKWALYSCNVWCNDAYIIAMCARITCMCPSLAGNGIALQSTFDTCHAFAFVMQEQQKPNIPSISLIV